MKAMFAAGHESMGAWEHGHWTLSTNEEPVSWAANDSTCTLVRSSVGKFITSQAGLFRLPWSICRVHILAALMIVCPLSAAAPTSTMLFFLSRGAYGPMTANKLAPRANTTNPLLASQ